MFSSIWWNGMVTLCWVWTCQVVNGSNLPMLGKSLRTGPALVCGLGLYTHGLELQWGTPEARCGCGSERERPGVNFHRKIFSRMKNVPDGQGLGCYRKVRAYMCASVSVCRWVSAGESERMRGIGNFFPDSIRPTSRALIWVSEPSCVVLFLGRCSFALLLQICHRPYLMSHTCIVCVCETKKIKSPILGLWLYVHFN